MSWLAIQGASRKPGAGDADVLNRLRIGRTVDIAAAAAVEKTVGSSLFKPPQLVRKDRAALAAKTSAGTIASTVGLQMKGMYGLPAWAKVGEALMYRSQSSKGGRLGVTVTKVEEQRVTVLFQDSSASWKHIPRAQVLDTKGPLRPLNADERVQKRARRSRSPRRRAVAVKPCGVAVEVLDDSGDEGEGNASNSVGPATRPADLIDDLDASEDEVVAV